MKKFIKKILKEDIESFGLDMYAIVNERDEFVSLEDPAITTTNISDKIITDFIQNEVEFDLEDRLAELQYDKELHEYIDYDPYKCRVIKFWVSFNMFNKSGEDFFDKMNESEDDGLDWIRDVMKTKWIPKPGEEFICNPGYNNYCSEKVGNEIDDPLNGGYGYRTGVTFTVSSVGYLLESSISGRSTYIIWPTGGSSGIFADACTPLLSNLRKL